MNEVYGIEDWKKTVIRFMTSQTVSLLASMLVIFAILPVFNIKLIKEGFVQTKKDILTDSGTEQS